MKMLDDIIDGAADDKVPLATILRKCLILASVLRNDKLKAWVLGELNGYEERQMIPPYRIFPVQAVGTFLGPFGSQLNDQPLAPHVMEQPHREWATTAYLLDPIATYEATLANPKGNDLISPWPATIVARYQTAFLKSKAMVLNRAHRRLARHAVAGMIDTVRTKLLEFALELRNDVGTSEPTPQNPPPAVVEHHVTNIIFGGQTNVSGGTIVGDVIQGVNQNIVKGDFASLSGALTQFGIPEGSLPDLKAAIAADKEAGHNGVVGPKTDGWIKATFKTIGTGALKVTEAVAQKAATAAVLAYLGLSAK